MAAAGCPQPSLSAASGFAQLARQLDTSAGLVSFSSLFVLVFTGAASLEISFKGLVRHMVYLDCAAFVLFYTHQIVDPAAATCASVGLWFAADLVWALKDAARIAYLVHRGLAIHGQRMARVVKGAGLLSVALYAAMLAQTYRFNSPATLMRQSAGVGSPASACGRQSDAPSETMVVLYLYWLAAELFSGTLVIIKLHGLVRRSATVPAGLESQPDGFRFQSQIARYRRLFRYQESSILLSIMLQAWVAIATLVRNAAGFAIPTLSTVVFTYSQLILVLSSLQSLTGGNLSENNDCCKCSTDPSANFSSSQGTVAGTKLPVRPAAADLPPPPPSRARPLSDTTFSDKTTRTVRDLA